MRVFIALDLAIRVVENLVLLQEDLAQPLRELGAKPRWTRTENIHLTLRFLGEIERSLVYRVRDQLRVIATQNAITEISTLGTGCFPDPKRPRILWVGTGAGQEPLEKLRSDIRSSLEEIGIEPDQRPFHPHVTIGRLKTPNQRVDVTDMLLPFSNTDFGKSRIKDIVLFESQLKRTGAVYSIIERFPLTGS